MTALQPLSPVLFVGAGPGAARHLTLGAYQALQAAEVVIHDRLVGPEIMALIPATARLVDVGKEGFGPSTKQVEINAILVAHALTGARVVRLKGGDPFVFGRGWDEATALRCLEVAAQRAALPARMVDLDVAGGEDLLEGDEITLYDEDRGFDGVAAIVDGPPLVGSSLATVSFRVPT